MISATLSSSVESALYCQERYERLREAAYRQAGRELCDLGYANFPEGPPAEVVRAIGDCLGDLRALDLQYTPYGGATITRRLIAESLSRSCSLPFGWRQVIMTPGAMAGLNLLFRALQAEDSSAEVIVVVPCWLDYPLYLVNLGLRPVLVPLAAGSWRLDVDRIAAAISPTTRAIVLSQPANPTGRVYSPNELADLAEVLRRRGEGRILLISDECHRDEVLPGGQFVPPAGYYDDTCIVYSFGKAFRIQGQRIGYIAVSPRMEGATEFARLLERLCRVTGFCTPTALMQLAVRRLLSLEIDLSPIARRRALMLHALREAGYDVEPSHGTYFLYAQSPDPDDFRFTELLGRRGLLVLPAAVFHHCGHFRVCLTAPDASVAKAAQVLTEVGRLVRPCPSGKTNSSSITFSGAATAASTSPRSSVSGTSN
jgi:aspartate aminotransferase